MMLSCKNLQTVHNPAMPSYKTLQATWAGLAASSSSPSPSGYHGEAHAAAADDDDDS
jgi:hypothetical protein